MLEESGLILFAVIAGSQAAFSISNVSSKGRHKQGRNYKENPDS